MIEFFNEGGFGMFFTLFFGVLFIGAAARYARTPENRLWPLLVSLGMMTLLAGVLGFVSGLTATLRYAAGHSEVPNVVLIGTAESLHNVALSLMLLVLGAGVAGFGAWRVARAAAPRAKVAG